MRGCPVPLYPIGKEGSVASSFGCYGNTLLCGPTIWILWEQGSIGVQAGDGSVSFHRKTIACYPSSPCRQDGESWWERRSSNGYMGC